MLTRLIARSDTVSESQAEYLARVEYEYRDADSYSYSIWGNNDRANPSQSSTTIDLMFTVTQPITLHRVVSVMTRLSARGDNVVGTSEEYNAEIEHEYRNAEYEYKYDQEKPEPSRDSGVRQSRRVPFCNRRHRTRTQAPAGTRTLTRFGATMTEPIFDHHRLDVYRHSTDHAASSRFSDDAVVCSWRQRCGDSGSVQFGNRARVPQC